MVEYADGFHVGLVDYLEVRQGVKYSDTKGSDTKEEYVLLQRE